MRRILQALTTIAVACVVPTFAIVVAQDQKASAPAVPTITVTTKTEVVPAKVEEKPAASKTTAAPAKGDAAKEKQDEEDKALAPLMQQFLPQLRPLLKSEIHLVEAVCKPGKEQLQKIEKDGDVTVNEVARAVAKVQQNMMQGRWGGANSNPDPRALIQASMTKSVKAHLTPDQANLYQTEVENRKASRKRVALRNIVAQMDIDLILTADQRDKIEVALASNWDETWSNTIEVFMYGENFMPNVPAKLTDPFLNEAQKKIWKATPRGQSIFFGGLGFLGGMMEVEVEAPAMAIEVNEVVVPADAKKVEEKAEEKKKP